MCTLFISLHYATKGKLLFLECLRVQMSYFNVDHLQMQSIPSVQQMHWPRRINNPPDYKTIRHEVTPAFQIDSSERLYPKLSSCLP
jgi:hypothetical protein